MNANEAPTAPPQEKKLIGYPELAEYLGISQDAIYQQMQRGKIPYFKFGRSVRFRLSDVKAKIETACKAAGGGRR